MSLKIAILCLIGLAVIASNGARAANPVVVLDTSMGTIKIELDEAKAPATVKNFLALTEKKFYDGTIFHRCMGKENSGRDFMIQGGGFLPGMNEKKSDTVKNESGNGLSNKRGSIAMARLGDPLYDSASCQFFINVKDNEFLDGTPGNNTKYTVFGKVTEGMDIVDKIKAVPTKTVGQHGDVPVTDVVIKSVKVQK
jgi:cyclophilin family peptidyl-prolyl cis-trans isomerase